MKSKFLIVYFVHLIFGLSCFAQQFLLPIELDDFEYYVDSVALDPKYDKKIGFVQKSFHKKKLSFGKEKIIDVMEGYLKSNFSFEENKKPLIVTINFLDVEILDTSNVSVTLSFFEKRGNELIFLNTIGANRYRFKHHESLISLAVQNCFETFQLFNQKQLNNSKLVDDIYYTRTDFPIKDIFIGSTKTKKGLYKDFLEFQNNILTSNETIKIVKLIGENEQPYFQVFVDEKIDVASYAVSDGEDVYFRVGRKYYRLFFDTEIHFFSHDFEKGLSRESAIAIGMLGVFPGLAIGDFGGGLIGMFAGSGIAVLIHTIIQNRKKRTVIKYNLDILSGKHYKAESD